MGSMGRERHVAIWNAGGRDRSSTCCIELATPVHYLESSRATIE